MNHLHSFYNLKNNMKILTLFIFCFYGFIGFSQTYHFIPDDYERIGTDEFRKKIVSDTIKVKVLNL